MANLIPGIGDLFQAGNALADAVQVQIGNKVYDGWSTVRISRNLNAMTSSFNLTVADKWRQSSEDWPFLPGEAITITANGAKIIVGYIDAMNTSVSNEDRSISISGRDKTGDLVDSAAIGLRSSYKNISIFEIAKEYAQDFDIEVEQDTPEALIPFAKVVVNQGETIFELLSRLAKERGVLLTSTTDGALKITDRLGIVGNRAKGANDLGSSVAKQLGDNTTALKQGKNILFASAKFDETNRFQKYLVKSQIKGDDFVSAKDSTTIKGVAFDRAVKRQRTKYIIADKSMDNAGAKKHAEWYANVHAVGSVDVEITVHSWRNAKNEVWEVNQTVEVEAPFIGVPKQQMLIIGVSYEQEKPSGTLCTLSLTRLDGFQAQPEVPVKNDTKKDAGWGDIFGNTLQDVAESKGWKN